MDHFGAGLAALGVIGPGIGIGILGGLAASAIGRNPDAAGQVRGIASSSRAFAEGLGVLAIVVGLLAIFIQRRSSRPAGSSDRGIPGARRTQGGHEVVRLPPAAEGDALPPINFFWVDRPARPTSSSSSPSSGPPPGSRSSARSPSVKERIAKGLADAEQAQLDRANAEAERVATLGEARREAREILERAQKVAQESRDADIAATKADLERLREQAAADIDAEKQRAIADLRSEVADLALAAAGKVVGQSMTGESQRRLVEEFLRESAANGSRN